MLTIDDVLTKNVVNILPSKQGLADLMAKRKIKLYQGFDPTGKLHIGHAIGLKKLMQFAELGHEVIFLFGTGTVLVGDPSQRLGKRKKITEGDIEESIKSWKKQTAPLVDFEKVKILKNGDWLNKLTILDIINISSNISAVQLFKRDIFQERTAKGDTVWYHETMYPILQGYDSVYMDVDLEIGGTDQEFNMLIGRELQKKINNKEKFVMTLPMIMGTDGMKMSKSSGNCIWLDDSPDEMYGKLMSIPDSLIASYIETLTDLPSDILSKEGPLSSKKKLASEIVRQIHGGEKTKKVENSFKKTFKKGEFPTEPIEISVSENTRVIDMFIKANISKSMSHAKRLVQDGAVDINGKSITDPTYIVKDGDKVKVGKKTFVRVSKK